MSDAVTILLVEDDEDDYLITREYLEEIPGRRVDLRWVDCYNAAMKMVQAGGIDICLVDYRIGGHTGLEFLANAKANDLHVPMVLLTGVGQRDIDVAATEAGAADFLDKSELSATILDRTIRYALANAASMKALAEKTGLLETTLENTGAGIAAFDTNGALIMSNNLFGTFLSRFDPDTSSTLTEPTLSGVKSTLGIELHETVCLVSPDGNVFELRQNVVPAGGSVVFVLDITEQKTLEKNIIRARNDAETASRAKSAFLSNISHELRTPLHSIIGYSELILSDSRALDPKDCAGQIHESGTHLLSLIESVLAYSKLESGEYSCKIDRIFELDGLIKSSIAQTAVAATRRQVTIDYSIDGEIESIFGDQTALRQILVNLLNNAGGNEHRDRAGRGHIGLCRLASEPGDVDGRGAGAGRGGAMNTIMLRLAPTLLSVVRKDRSSRENTENTNKFISIDCLILPNFKKASVMLRRINDFFFCGRTSWI